jgi:hypothetical protein
MSHPHPLRRAESFSVNPPRNISAPFQNRNDHDVRSNSPTKVGDRFEQYEFAPLEKISDVTFEKVTIYSIFFLACSDHLS